MKLGATIGFSGDPTRLTERARQLESAGIEHLWTGEAYTSDAVSTMGFLAAVTERATIGSTILPIYSRTPTLLAMTAVGLDQLSGGRFILGLGASGPQVIEGFHGVPYDRPLGRTREIIDICHSVWAGERLEHQGQSYRMPLGADRGTGFGKPLRLATTPVRTRIPIHLAALGPRNVELAAEKCEGWIPINFWPERADEVWGEALARGRSARAPDLPPLDVVAGGPLAIGQDVAHLRDELRPRLALYFGGMGARRMNFYNDLLRRYGYDDLAQEIQDAYLGGRRDDAAALVPQDLIDAMCLIGDEGYVRDRVAAYRDAGVTILNVEPRGPDRRRDVETVARWLA